MEILEGTEGADEHPRLQAELVDSVDPQMTSRDALLTRKFLEPTTLPSIKFSEVHCLE